MAYGVMPETGGEFVCESCDHLDCEEWRELIDSSCQLCEGPVEGGERYVNRGEGIAHYTCHLEDLEGDDG